MKKCSKCKGTGKIGAMFILHGMPHLMGKKDCPDCKGTGKKGGKDD